MNVVISREELNAAISMVQKAISTRSALAILDGILLEAEGNDLVLTGYDLETGIECRIPCEVKCPGRLVLRSRLFGDIIRKLPEERVSLEKTEDGPVLIQSGKARYKIDYMAGEYPKIPEVEKTEQLSVSQNVLRDMIQETIFAASSDESRPVLNGINLVLEDGKLELVAIDGFRLAVREEDIEDKDKTLQYIVPAKAMQEVARILDKSDEPVQLYSSHNYILFANDKVRLVSRLIQGEFMNYENIIPQSSMTSIKLQKQDLLDAIERCALIINVDQRRYPITLQSEDDGRLVVSATTDIGNAREELMCHFEGEPIDVDFNPRYFLDALRNIPDDEIMLDFGGSASSCLIKPLEGDKFLYLLLPLRR